MQAWKPLIVWAAAAAGISLVTCAVLAGLVRQYLELRL